MTSLSSFSTPGSPATSGAVVPPYRSQVGPARITFGRLVRAETIALFSLRSTYVVLLIGGGLTFAISLLATLAFTASGLTEAPFFSFATIGLLFAQIAATMTGAGLYAKEHSSGSLRTQFAAAPRRVKTMLAKATTLFVSVFVLGVVLLVVSLAASAVVFAATGRTVGLDAGILVPLVLGGATVLALTSVLGLGVAALVRSEALTIAIVLVLLLVVPVLLTLAADQEWVRVISELMFSHTTATLTTPVNVAGDVLLRDALVSIAWPAAALAIGATAVARRDA